MGVIAKICWEVCMSIISMEHGDTDTGEGNLLFDSYSKLACALSCRQLSMRRSVGESIAVW